MGLRDSRGQPFDEAGIKGLRDDVTLPEAEGLALIGGGNFGGHRLLGQRGEGAGGGKLHGLVDFRGVHVQRPAENVGEAGEIVDLVPMMQSGRVSIASG